MKIKLAILDQDKNYLSRVASVFASQFADKIEFYSFTDENIALSSLSTIKIDVVLASDVFEIDVDKIPKRCGFAYFVDSPDIETYRGQRAVCKFQKVELIYKEILGIFSENVSDLTGMKFEGEYSKVITFVSASGGVGSSTVAAACAKHFAQSGKSVLYLNLEQFGSSDLFFSGEGQFDFSDIIFAIKSQKANLSLKLESNVKKDASGVCFYSAPKSALDLMELKTEDIKRLISEIKMISSYEYIIIDMDFSINKNTIEILKVSEAIVFISDGSDNSNIKFMRAYKALEIMDQQMDTSFLSHISIMYNKFSNKTGKTIAEGNIKALGGTPKYEHATSEQVIQQLLTLKIFDDI